MENNHRSAKLIIKRKAYVLYNVSLLFVLLVTSFSCKNDLFKFVEDPIAQVGKESLYEKDLSFLFYEGILPEDSVLIRNRYIETWIKDILIYEKATSNINNNDEIEELVEKYRKSLLIYEYKLQLIKDRLKSNSITKDELKQFYEENLEQFYSKEILIKGLFFIIPNNAPDKEMLKTLLRYPKGENYDLIENLSIKNASKFEFFSDNWLPLNEILKKSPIKVENIKYQNFIENSDSTSTYWLTIQEYKNIGELEPFEYVENRIRSLILENKKNVFLNKFTEDLYEEGIKNEYIKIN